MCRNSLQRSRSTLSPRKLNSVAALMPLVSQSMASNRAEPIAGIITLSSSCPACVMCAIAASCPSTWKQTWLSISNITGLTLPGMMLEPGCTAGSRISPMPVRGPEASRRMSFAMRGGVALDVGGRVLLRGEVGGGADAFAGETRELGRGIHRIFRRGVEARASGAATEPDLAQCVARLLEALRAAAQYPRVGTELAADGGGHRVLQVRAAALDGVDLLQADARVFVGHGAYGLQQPR